MTYDHVNSNNKIRSPSLNSLTPKKQRASSWVEKYWTDTSKIFCSGTRSIPLKYFHETLYESFLDVTWAAGERNWTHKLVSNFTMQ